MMAVYLDFNATSPIDERVLKKMIEVYRSNYGNADSRTHIFGMKAKGIVNDARKTIAKILNVDNTDVFFTSGSTESNNMAIIGLLEFAQKSGRNHFITTAIEHKSVLEPMKFLEKHGCQVDYVYPDGSGRIKKEQILSLITNKTLLVSIMHVNSETGIIQPIEDIGKELANTEIYFHIDATQGFGKLNDVLRQTKYNMLSITAHKIGGPQGIGCLIMRRDNNYKRPPLIPLMYGGEQERGYRPGTTPVALVAGFAFAAKICDQEEQQNMDKCRLIKESFFESIKNLDYNINGEPKYCLPSTINISFENIDAESLLIALKENYAFSNGSACNAGSHSLSYVLKAMGFSDKRINEAVRISWNHSTHVDFKNLAEYIKSMV